MLLVRMPGLLYNMAGSGSGAIRPQHVALDLWVSG